MDRERSGAAASAMDTLHDLSSLLNTGLTPEQLRACVELIEQGVGPEAVATAVKELRKEAANAPAARDK
ncbi:hypothetical protein FA09DRAFT_337868 [Tilletiopsis washingtonensis]|uniref:Mitotic-spindle organizing protein 1 n=1 Tax=Tilletiopsis washingtonensis TaxID=58919 RepID=A0A316ZC95_9BASI|nr:hypothetical protein FA09DRAFT_337868 [Tilletiopsis washingtonensis]PWN99149.1 hypothetical protein FA09DRAFT_337868 [Tilletiopsis washingtonensis]